MGNVQVREGTKLLFTPTPSIVFLKIGDGIPSFAISLYKEYRGNGIGTELMKRMLAELKSMA